ncbi:MAG: hypothetical protein ACK5HP_01145 [Bacilli bacterium]
METIILNKKKINLNLEDHILLNNDITYEGQVYKYKGTALKLFNELRLENAHSFLNVNGFKDLVKLEPYMYRFVLPSHLVFNTKGKLIGYVTKLIGNEKDINKIYNKNIKKIIHEFNLIKHDYILLTNNKFKLMDLTYNYIYNGNINIIDPGLYEKNLKFYLNNKQLKIDNLKAINEFLVGITLFTSSNLNYYYNINNFLVRNYTKKYCEEIYFGDYIKEEAKIHGYESVNDLIQHQKTKMKY